LFQIGLFEANKPPISQPFENNERNHRTGTEANDKLSEGHGRSSTCRLSLSVWLT
jgi:hypothetical protein